ncbi:MAG: zinc-binding dehydrogenase [Eubacteriales bacterium]|nr:zinc-binding dehydrogenase [Clostridia bacterium]MDY2844893.1 zinc-binding dehydrogenase [Eubacteriales bacterium]
MKTRAVRLHGVMDLRLEEIELPEIKDGEILACIISDSICMSSYKAASQGAAHKRVPDDVAENPVIIGHEFCGKIVKVGAKWADKFKAGDKFVIQPAINYKGSLASPGYSYKYCGGASEYVIIPEEVMLMDCLLPYNGDAFFYGSLSEPMSCIIGGYHACYHTKPGVYTHDMGVTEGGNMAILAGAGPMGLGCADYAIHGGRAPKMLIVTDLDDARLKRAEKLLPPEEAKKLGVDLRFINTGSIENPVEYLRSLTGGEGFNDVFVYAPVKPVVEMGDALLARDGCLNFFAGPTNPEFSAMFNFYNVHYLSTHIVGTSGGNTDDMREAIKLMETKAINPAGMITHVGGLNACAETTMNLPKIKGAKKLIYTHVELPLTAIEDFGKAAEENKGTKLGELYADLDAICKDAGELWCAAAEKRLLEYAGFEA